MSRVSKISRLNDIGNHLEMVRENLQEVLESDGDSQQTSTSAPQKAKKEKSE